MKHAIVGEKGAMRQSRVLIIGGGAAGLTAAIAAARRGASVTLLEGGARVGQKILASGNGRCNLTNLSTSPEAYNHPDFVSPVLDAYTCERVCAFFGEMGLLTRADDEGRVYPATNAAGSVLDVLRMECAHLGVDVRCGFEVVRVVEVPSGGFDATSEDGETLRAEAVVVTTGGACELLGNLGHELIECVPVLGPIQTDAAPIRGLSGVRVKCAATLLGGVADGGAGGEDAGGNAIATERGELLFRDYGVSGIMIFDLSRYLEAGCVISIDFFPDVTQPELESMISQRCDALAWRTAETFFAGMLHDRVARAMLRAAGVSGDTPVTEVPQVRLVALLKDFRLRVLGLADAGQAQVTRGGAAVAEFVPDTMASRRVDGLFAAGEVLDIDGRSGGFNLHWAWASGIMAGESAARAAMTRAAESDGSSRGSA
ncbi:MAG: aminoacetone oxidase family FAD-binding enzyme [Actinomycetota bacterium]|nr:MAG: Flavoprotein family [Actinomycetota bacterium]MDP3630110.1 aminoacetone oxidase family FAD-binding enzyme [Actinomycetota bacterium]